MAEHVMAGTENGIEGISCEFSLISEEPASVSGRGGLGDAVVVVEMVGTGYQGPPSTRFWVARGAVASMGVARLSGRGGLGDAAVVVEIVGIQDGK